MSDTLNQLNKGDALLFLFLGAEKSAAVLARNEREGVKSADVVPGLDKRILVTASGAGAGKPVSISGGTVVNHRKTFNDGTIGNYNYVDHGPAAELSGPWDRYITMGETKVPERDPDESVPLSEPKPDAQGTAGEAKPVAGAPPLSGRSAPTDDGSGIVAAFERNRDWAAPAAIGGGGLLAALLYARHRMNSKDKEKRADGLGDLFGSTAATPPGADKATPTGVPDAGTGKNLNLPGGYTHDIGRGHHGVYDATAPTAAGGSTQATYRGTTGWDPKNLDAPQISVGISKKPYFLLPAPGEVPVEGPSGEPKPVPIGVASEAKPLAGPGWWDRNKAWALPAGVAGGGLLAGLMYARHKKQEEEEEQARRNGALKFSAEGVESGVGKTRKLGPLETNAAARAEANELPAVLKTLAGQEYSSGGMPVRGALARLQGGLHGAQQRSEGSKYVSKPLRIGSAILGDEGGQGMDNWLELGGVFGDPRNVDKARDAYTQHIAPHNDAKQVAPGQADLGLLTRALDKTPRTVMNAADVVGRDATIAGHKYNRTNNPLNYWLNPFVSSGPLNEIDARLQRRSMAEKADPDATYRPSLYVPGVPLLRSLTGDNSVKRDKARNLAESARALAHGEVVDERKSSNDVMTSSFGTQLSLPKIPSMSQPKAQLAPQPVPSNQAVTPILPGVPNLPPPAAVPSIGSSHGLGSYTGTTSFDSSSDMMKSNGLLGYLKKRAADQLTGQIRDGRGAPISVAVDSKPIRDEIDNVLKMDPSIKNQIPTALALGAAPVATGIGALLGGLHGAAGARPGDGTRQGARGGLVGAGTGLGAALGGAAGLGVGGAPAALLGALGGGLVGRYGSKAVLGDEEERKYAFYASPRTNVIDVAGHAPLRVVISNSVDDHELPGLRSLLGWRAPTNESELARPLFSKLSVMCKRAEGGEETIGAIGDGLSDAYKATVGDKATGTPNIVERGGAALGKGFNSTVLGGQTPAEVFHPDVGGFLDKNRWANGMAWGAPIGAGLGLLGGMFNRKKKKDALTDALRGGLLGAAAGGLGGAAWDVADPKTGPPPAPATPAVPSVATIPANSGLPGAPVRLPQEAKRLGDELSMTPEAGKSMEGLGRVVPKMNQLGGMMTETGRAKLKPVQDLIDTRTRATQGKGMVNPFGLGTAFGQGVQNAGSAVERAFDRNAGPALTAADFDAPNADIAAKFKAMQGAFNPNTDTGINANDLDTDTGNFLSNLKNRAGGLALLNQLKEQVPKEMPDAPLIGREPLHKSYAGPGTLVTSGGIGALRGAGRLGLINKTVKGYGPQPFNDTGSVGDRVLSGTLDGPTAARNDSFIGRVMNQANKGSPGKFTSAGNVRDAFNNLSIGTATKPGTPLPSEIGRAVEQLQNPGIMGSTMPALHGSELASNPAAIKGLLEAGKLATTPANEDALKEYLTKGTTGHAPTDAVFDKFMKGKNSVLGGQTVRGPGLLQRITGMGDQSLRIGGQSPLGKTTTVAGRILGGGGVASPLNYKNLLIGGPGSAGARRITDLSPDQKSTAERLLGYGPNAVGINAPTLPNMNMPNLNVPVPAHPSGPFGR